MASIVEKAESVVSTLLAQHRDTKLLYHNLRHTERVVNSAKTLLKAHNIGAQEAEYVVLAAWFHDTGYTKGVANHEQLSCTIATQFLNKNRYPVAGIIKVRSYIMATQRYYKPKSLCEAIIRDADMSHFAQKNCMQISNLLREELYFLGIAQYSDREWIDQNIAMFQDEHQFYTAYAQEHWEPQKQSNLKQLLSEKEMYSY